MDRLDRARLQADLYGQLMLIDQVDHRLRQRVAAGLGTPAQLESIAYQIHNLYCAVEDLLKIVATTFENHIGNGGQWYRVLLLRLSQPIPDVRPAFLSVTTLQLLNPLRSFRHFIRHAYGSEIELTQLQVNLDLALSVREQISQDIINFLENLAPIDPHETP